MEENKTDSAIKIAYQNKDISSKYLASMHGEAFARVLGLQIAPLERNEPTELPAVEVNDMMMDNLFLLTDGSYVIIDYESEYREENKIKYLGYIARLMKRLYNQVKKVPALQVAVIYTADVEAGQTRDVLDWEYGKFVIKEAFLTSWDTERILKSLEDKAERKAAFTDEDQIRLIMVTLSAKGDSKKLDVIRRCIDIIEKLEDEKLQIYLYGGLIAFTDKVIKAKELEEIRRRMSMTKIEKMFYDEKIEAIKNIAVNFLKDGQSPESVSKNTGLDISVVKELAEKIKEPVSV